MKYLTKRQHKRKKKVDIFNRLEQQQHQQQFYAYHSGNLDLDLEPDSPGTGQEDDDDMQGDDQDQMVEAKNVEEEDNQMGFILSMSTVKSISGKGCLRSSYKSKQNHHRDLIVSSSNSLVSGTTYESNHLKSHRRSSLSDTQFHQVKSSGSGQEAEIELEATAEPTSNISDSELEYYYHRNKPLTLGNFMDMERFGGQQIDIENEYIKSDADVVLEEGDISSDELLTAAGGVAMCTLLGPPVHISYAGACRSEQKQQQQPKVTESNSYFSTDDCPIIKLGERVQHVMVEDKWAGRRADQKVDKEDELSPKTLALLKHTAFGPLESMKKVDGLTETTPSVGFRSLIIPNDKPTDRSTASTECWPNSLFDNHETTRNKNRKGKPQLKPIGYEKALAAARLRNSQSNCESTDFNLNPHMVERGQNSSEWNNWWHSTQTIYPDPNPNSIVESIKSIWLRERPFDKEKDRRYNSGNIWTTAEPGLEQERDVRYGSGNIWTTTESGQELNPRHLARLNTLQVHGHNLPLYQINKSHNTNLFPDYHHSSITSNPVIPPATSNTNTNFNMFNSNTRCQNRNYNASNMRMQHQQHHPLRYNFTPQQQHQHNYLPHFNSQSQQQIYHAQQQHMHAQRQQLQQSRLNYKSPIHNSNTANNWLEYMELFPLNLSQEELTAAQMYAIYGESFFEMPMGKRYKRSLNSAVSTSQPQQHYQQQQSGVGGSSFGSVALGASSIMRHLTGQRGRNLPAAGPAGVTGSLYRSNCPTQAYLGHCRMPPPFNSSTASSGPAIFAASNPFDQMMASSIPTSSTTVNPSAIGVRHAFKLNTANFPPLPAPNQKRNQKD